MRIVRAIGFVPLASISIVVSCGGGSHSFPPSMDAAAASDGAPTGDGGPNLVGNGDTGGRPCVGLQCQQVDCASQGQPVTTVSGIVYDPAGNNPLYNVIAYVPNSPVQPFHAGVTCDQCGVLASGSPVVTALTGADGKFVLTNAPAGDDIPLVIQIGKWRKQLTIAHVQACADTPMTDPRQMRLPATQAEGDMPEMAIATGGCDPFECLLRKIGIRDSEFTEAGGSGKVHLYQGLGNPGVPGASLSASTTSATQLWASSTLQQYDLVANACECVEHPEEKPQSSIDNIVAYADAGGRLFNTHFHYYWIDPSEITPIQASNPAWATTATFIPPTMGNGSIPGYVDMTFPKGSAFAQWLFDVGASPNLGQFPIDEARYNATGVNPPSTQWVYNTSVGQTGTAQPALLHYTFNTPVGVPDDKQCGKVLFSDFHVEQSLSSATTFPIECNTQPMSPQEKALEFMLFDLSSCIQKESDPPRPPTPIQ